MASQLQLRGGTTAEHGSFTGAIRELTVDTTLKALRLHDGVTAGGTVIAGLSDIQALITALSNSTSVTFASEASTRTTAIDNLTTVVNTANSDRAAADTAIEIAYGLADVATLSSAYNYTDSAISNLLGGAPDLLNTLNELAAAIGDDSNFITTLTTSISNETTARTSADIALDIRLAALETDTTSATAVAAVQADVDQNETDSDAAVAAVQADVDQNEADADATIAALQADVDQNEADCDSAIAAVQADVDQNESDADTAIALKAPTDNPTFTTKVSSPEYHSDGGHLKFKAATNDIMFYPNNIETLQITRSGTDCRFTSNGGTGTFKFNQQVDLAGGMKVGGVEVTADAAELNYVDGVTSNIQTQLDATNAAITTSNTSTLTSAQSYADTAVSNLVDAAPGAINTLNELAAAINDDESFSATVATNIAAVQTDVNANEVAASAATAAVQSDVDANETAINASLSTETSARTSADSALSARLDTAEAKSSYSDPTTQTLLTAETSARTSADSTLSGRLDTLEADDTTQTLLTAEATTRASADTALSARLDTAEAKTSYSDPTTQTLLTAETTARTSADSALSARLNTAEGKSSYSDPTTQTLLTAEASTRSSADSALSARLDTAEAKSSYSDPTTQTLLSAEATTRAAAVITLQTNIDTITTARTVDEERHLQAGLATGYLYVSNFSGG